jgi:hypothetical protein
MMAPTLEINMTNATFTDNEITALKRLYVECLAGMGGKTWEDLESDPYTWVYPETLVAHGWSIREAGGTFSSLIVKGAIDEVDAGEWALNLKPKVRIAVEA